MDKYKDKLILLANIKKLLLLRTVLINDYDKYKIYNIASIGNKYKLYRGNGTLIAEFNLNNIKKLFNGEILFSLGKSIKLLPKNIY